MKHLNEYIIQEVEQSKRMLSPMPWHEFFSKYKSEKIETHQDKINFSTYLNDDIVEEMEKGEFAKHPERYGTNPQTMWYVICGNFKDSWTGFNINAVKSSLGDANETHTIGNCEVQYYDECVFITLGVNFKVSHWTMIAPRQYFENELGLYIQ